MDGFMEVFPRAPICVMSIADDIKISYETLENAKYKTTAHAEEVYPSQTKRWFKCIKKTQWCTEAKYKKSNEASYDNTKST